MAALDLTGIPIATAGPRIVDFGGVVGGGIGGASLRINRLGTRWAWRFQTTPMKGQLAYFWTGMLAQARTSGARLKISQPGLDLGAPNAAFVTSSTPSGRFVPVSNMGPGYPMRRGQWLSFVRASGDRYLDMNLNDVFAKPDGSALLFIANLLRAPLAAGDTVEILEPKIEGWITDFDEWTIERSRTIQMAFTIVEAA